MKKIKYLVMDVDGTLTNGKIYIGNKGEIFKAFNVKDGYGIHHIAIPNKIVPVIITGRESNIVLNRCMELGIEKIYQGINDKTEILFSITGDLSEVAYIGDDINDVSCMNFVKNAGGLVGCPNDAIEYVRNIADYISPSRAGEGAVRDFIEWICNDFN